MGGVANVADEADEGWVAGVDGDGDGFDAVGGDEEVGGAPVGPVAGQAQGAAAKACQQRKGRWKTLAGMGRGRLPAPCRKLVGDRKRRAQSRPGSRVASWAKLGPGVWARLCRVKVWEPRNSSRPVWYACSHAGQTTSVAWADRVVMRSPASTPSGSW